jgi:hypothetical protein
MSVQDKLESEIQVRKTNCTNMFLKALINNLTEEDLVKEFFENRGNYYHDNTAILRPRKFLNTWDKIQFQWNQCSYRENQDVDKIEEETIKHWKEKGITHVECESSVYSRDVRSCDVIKFEIGEQKQPPTVGGFLTKRQGMVLGTK